MAARILAVAGVALAAAAIAVLAFVYGPIPSRRGIIDLPGLRAPVEVVFDRAGIPHVHAVLEADAWRALGWLHASDRLFQMELRRRAAEGRLAEIFGRALVPRDLEARRWGHGHGAEEDLAALDERETAALAAYADGVNAFLESEPLPLELRLLHVTPEPWTPLDSLAFGRRMLEGLTIAGDRERAVFDEARSAGVDATLARVDASDGIPTRVPPEVRELLAALPAGGLVARTGSVDVDEAVAGSNAWAIAGSRTASGRPLLAGDPHLNPERPGIWYAAHLQSDDGLDVIGLTLPGVPGVIIGHNADVAWSITMNQADDVDWYLERLDPQQASARKGEAWEPLARRGETIRVKDGPPAEEEILATRHGPVVEILPGHVALARAWASGPERHGVGAYLAAARARTGDDLRRAFRPSRGPAINLCWADRAGGIGVSVFGAIPRRGAGDGRFPAPGWDPAYDWQGLVDAGSLPAIESPREGYVATANDDWSAAGIALPYPGLFADSDRVRRARELAAALHGAHVSDMRTMQTDLYSPYASRIVAALAGIPLTQPRAIRARMILTTWNACAELRGPSRLFFAFLREARARAGAPNGSGTAGSWVTWALLDRMISGRAPESLWDDPSTPGRERRAARVESALVAALDRVEHEDGRIPSHWSWGRVHRLAYAHPLAPGLPEPVARRLLIGPLALPGEWHTLDVAGFRLDGDGYDVVHIPSARLIVDLGDLDQSRIVLPLGQSGQVLDRHAKDQTHRWAEGRDYPLPFSARAIAAQSVSTQSFRPAR